MRRTAYPKELVQILRKNTTPKMDPKAPHPGDNHKSSKAVIIDGKIYVEKTAGEEGPVPLTEGVGHQVHQAVKAPSKPVTTRIKQGKTQAAN